ncbi:MAG: KOW domain-containing RNA-binding protein [Armatimonadota bacterium]|nr:KOW domain-containing RNA-binding protein [Armatimonadota bacterium]
MVVDDGVNQSTALVGMVVTSRAGRDAGDRYVVVGAAGHDMVLVADGRRRQVSRPKRKNIKHLVVHGPAGHLAGRLRDGQAVTDEELRAILGAEAPERRSGAGMGA